MTTFIIAEAGVNHNGSLERAKALIDVAADAGANAVKFQTFQAKRLVTQLAPKAGYQLKTTDEAESQLNMLTQLELSEAAHVAIFQHAKVREIACLSTPFDEESLRLLTQRFAMTTIKVSSGDLTHAPFLLEIARHAQKVILSTGMATIAEVEAALGVLAYGFLNASALPKPSDFETAFASNEGQALLKQRVTLLHCTSEYPAPVIDVNLRVMQTLKQAFGLPVGYSDHTQGIHIPVAAVALGAEIIEKHFTVDKTLPGPDHQASLSPDELHAMVKAIRDVEKSLGDGVKRPTPSELNTRMAARRSLVAKEPIAIGSPLKVACKRPGTGVSPFRYWEFLERRALRAFQCDELLDE